MVRLSIARSALFAVALGLGGCSGGGLSTGSLFGGGSDEKTAAPAANDPTARAFQVGSTSARAVKCGYNFDPVRLRANFLATEAIANPAGTGNIEKVYDTAYGGVTKAIGSDGSYCSGAKTAEIKQDLSRHLAGDYTPAARKVAAGPGLFDAIGDGNGNADGPKWGSGDWWDSQDKQAGR